MLKRTVSGASLYRKHCVCVKLQLQRSALVGSAEGRPCLKCLYSMFECAPPVLVPYYPMSISNACLKQSGKSHARAGTAFRHVILQFDLLPDLYQIKPAGRAAVRVHGTVVLHLKNSKVEGMRTDVEIFQRGIASVVFKDPIMSVGRDGQST